MTKDNNKEWQEIQKLANKSKERERKQKRNAKLEKTIEKVVDDMDKSTKKSKWLALFMGKHF